MPEFSEDISIMIETTDSDQFYYDEQLSISKE